MSRDFVPRDRHCSITIDLLRNCGCLLIGTVNEVIDDERWMMLGGFRGRSRAAPT